jgi:hypothetical protein
MKQKIYLMKLFSLNLKGYKFEKNQSNIAKYGDILKI